VDGFLACVACFCYVLLDVLHHFVMVAIASLITFVLLTEGRSARDIPKQLPAKKRIRWENLMRPWDRCEVHEDVDGSLMIQLFSGYCFHNFLERVSKHLHQCLVMLFVNTTIILFYTLGQSLLESFWK